MQVDGDKLQIEHRPWKPLPVASTITNCYPMASSSYGHWQCELDSHLANQRKAQKKGRKRKRDFEEEEAFREKHRERQRKYRLRLKQKLQAKHDAESPSSGVSSATTATEESDSSTSTSSADIPLKGDPECESLPELKPEVAPKRQVVSTESRTAKMDVEKQNRPVDVQKPLKRRKLVVIEVDCDEQEIGTTTSPSLDHFGSYDTPEVIQMEKSGPSLRGEDILSESTEKPLPSLQFLFDSLKVSHKLLQKLEAPAAPLAATNNNNFFYDCNVNNGVLVNFNGNNVHLSVGRNFEESRGEEEAKALPSMPTLHNTASNLPFRFNRKVRRDIFEDNTDSSSSLGSNTNNRNHYQDISKSHSTVSHNSPGRNEMLPGLPFTSTSYDALVNPKEVKHYWQTRRDTAAQQNPESAPTSPYRADFSPRSHSPQSPLRNRSNIRSNLYKGRSVPIEQSFHLSQISPIEQTIFSPPMEAGGKLDSLPPQQRTSNFFAPPVEPLHSSPKRLGRTSYSPAKAEHTFLSISKGPLILLPHPQSPFKKTHA